jgi:hypothetical protein
MIAHSFAGLAVCYLLGVKCESRFISFTSLSVSVSADPLTLAATLRHFPFLMCCLSSKDEVLRCHKTMLAVTEQILLPAMLHAGRRDLFDFEVGIWSGRPRVEQLAREIAQVTGRYRVIDRQLVDYKCAACGAMEGKHSRCSGCGKVYYCGKACQRSDWRGHKVVCRK